MHTTHKTNECKIAVEIDWLKDKYYASTVNFYTSIVKPIIKGHKQTGDNTFAARDANIKLLHWNLHKIWKSHPEISVLLLTWWYVDLIDMAMIIVESMVDNDDFEQLWDSR